MMGWGSAGEIFDPVANLAKAAVDAEAFTEQAAEDLLSELIDKLRDMDWDTMDESLEQFEDTPFIVRAFARNDQHVRYDLDDEESVEKLVLHARMAGKPGEAPMFLQQRIAKMVVRAFENR